MLAAYQQCRSLAGWTPMFVRSESDPERSYLVLVDPWGELGDNICECPGFEYRRHCKHQRIARRQLCGWSQVVVQAEVQSDEQHKEMICPRCDGATMWAFTVKEDD